MLPCALVQEAPGPNWFGQKMAMTNQDLHTEENQKLANLEKLPDSRERSGVPVLWLSCEGQIDVWEMFSANFDSSQGRRFN